MPYSACHPYEGNKLTTCKYHLNCRSQRVFLTIAKTSSNFAFVQNQPCNWNRISKFNTATRFLKQTGQFTILARIITHALR